MNNPTLMIGFVCTFEFSMIFAFANIYPIFKLHQAHNYYAVFLKHITNTFMHGLDLTKRIVSGMHGHMQLGVLRNLIFLIIMQIGVIIKFCHVVVGFVCIFEFFMMFFAFVFSW
jgi:hypothetical protein